MTSATEPGSDVWPLKPSARQKGSAYTSRVFDSGPATAPRYSASRSVGSAGSNWISSASAGGTVTITWGACTITSSALTTTLSGCWVIDRTGVRR